MKRLRKNLNDPKDWERIFNIFTDGIYITNSQGLTLKVNEAYQKITGVKEEDVLGKYMEDIVREGILSTSITQKVIRTQKEVNEKQTINNGRKVVLRGIPIFDENGEIEIVVTIVRDNTVINQIQEELNKSRVTIDQYKQKLNFLENETKTNKFVALSKGFLDAVSLARRVANVDSTVLILGESGTGKEIIAREIHEKSHRANQLFLKINCGAIPENLLEAELFGYESGAFTGAKKNGHVGIFEMASKGTVFLDEIGDMPLMLQVKLLRVLQEKTVTRIGASTPIEIDTRVIAATNLDLAEMVKEKLFRKDLYYRLNVVVIKSPPLRERKEEIPQLTEFFIRKLNSKYQMRKRLSPAVLKEFMDYHWPGNVRELENMIERILVTSEEEEISFKEDLFPWRMEEGNRRETCFDEIIPLKEAFEKVERKLILDAYKKYHTTYEMAEALKISQPSVSRKLRKYRKEAEEEG